MITLENFHNSLKVANRLETNQFCVSVLEYPHPIQRSFSLSNKHELIPSNSLNFEKRTQDLAKYYHDAGQFYWASAKTWLKAKTILANSCLGIEIPRYEAIDIDTEEDWKLAEIISFQESLRQKNN
jgi:N-acylneuraminate cytidylyltransferase